MIKIIISIRSKKEPPDLKTQKDEKDENLQYTKPLKIKIGIALDFFLKDKIGIENENSKLKKNSMK